MCSLCHGTHVVHEENSFSSRFIGCPVCGPEADEVWRDRLENFTSELRKKREEVKYVSS